MKLSAYIALFYLIIGGLAFTCAFGETPIPTNSTESYHIIGLPQAILENAETRLKSSGANSPTQVEKEIILAIQPYGYLHPEITHQRISQDKTHAIQYTVNLGPPLYIIAASIQITGPGAENQKIQQALKNKKLLKVGSIFTSPAYNNMQTFMFALAHNNGYATAEMVIHEVRVNPKKNEATVLLTLDTGPIFYYGAVSFSPSPYNTSFLKRFVPFQQGQVYSPIAVQKLQGSLSNSKYFSAASVVPQIDKADDNDNIPIQIDTEAVKSQQYNFGLGYGTNTGARTSMGVDLYRITDTGQHLSALLNFSAVTTSITTKYFIPGKQPNINQYVIGTYLGQFHPDAGSAYTKQLFVGYETKLNSQWSSSTNLNYLHERFQINDDPYHTTDLIYPSFNLSRLSADNDLNPQKGSRVTLNVSGSPPGVAEEFAQAELSGKWIYPPSRNNFIILRGDAGTTYASDYNTTFPLSMRFFAGGFNSVRGYSYESLGPGKYLKVASAEVQQRIVGDFFTGIFVDEGNASNNVNQSLERGIGLDFVYRTSVGPISIDIAQANTDPNKPLSIEFNFGANL